MSGAPLGTRSRPIQKPTGDSLKGDWTRDRQDAELRQTGGWTVTRIWWHEDPDTPVGQVVTALNNSPAAYGTRKAAAMRRQKVL